MRLRRGIGPRLSLIHISPDTADEVEKEVDVVWRIPGVPADLAPVLTIVPMQMLAYYMALEKGCDIDKPRNLAKSVTVE